MFTYYSQIYPKIQSTLQTIDFEGSDITLDESVKMIDFFKGRLSEMREYFLLKESLSIEEEVQFFKEIKPEVLGMLLYFSKIHNIQLKCPNGSNITQKEYYENELRSLTFFFERNLDFYQYYRAKSTHLDEYYFVRGKNCRNLCMDSTHYVMDPLFSTGYDYKVAKIICNEMLRIYLNKKLHSLEKQSAISKAQASSPKSNLQWTASKIAAIEMGYSLHSNGVFNNGNTDVKEILTFFETYFGIDLGDYYRTYIAIKSRKKDRTPFLSKLIESLIRRMDNDDSE